MSGSPPVLLAPFTCCPAQVSLPGDRPGFVGTLRPWPDMWVLPLQSYRKGNDELSRYGVSGPGSVEVPGWALLAWLATPLTCSWQVGSGGAGGLWPEVQSKQIERSPLAISPFSCCLWLSTLGVFLSLFSLVSFYNPTLLLPCVSIRLTGADGFSAVEETV